MHEVTQVLCFICFTTISDEAIFLVFLSFPAILFLAYSYAQYFACSLASHLTVALCTLIATVCIHHVQLN